MTINEVLGTIRRNIHLAIVGVFILLVLFVVGYFVIYKKLLRGQKKITIKHGVMLGLFAGYLIMVMGVTLNRGGGGIYSFNFNFLSSYKEAWNNFDVRTWQNLIFNIIMFVPLGIMLPFAHKKFHNIIYTLSLGLGFTMFIEFIQFVMNKGVFDMADIFNNLLGTLVGYSIVMTLIILAKGQKYKYRKALVYFSPFIIVVVLFAGMFTYYNLKEFGNLSENYDYKLNLKNTTITTDINFSSEEKIIPIYKAPTLSKEASKEFVVDFFENINVNTSSIEIIDYHEEAVYWVRGDKGSNSYNIWLNNLNGSFSYTDWSMSDDSAVLTNAPAEVIVEKLENFNINIPREVEIKSEEVGNYIFTVNNKTSEGNTLVNGILFCSYYNDDTIKSIDNDIVVYEKVKGVYIISEMEAYKNITEGRFSYIINHEINTIEINDICIDYRLDSKGYYQPVYIFNSIIDNVPHSIIIPALS